MFHDVFQNKILNSNLPVKVLGLNKKIQASYVWNLFNVSNKSILVVTNTVYEANNLYRDLSVFSDAILLFPMDDFLVSEALAISPDLMSKRIETLNELSFANEKKIIITNLMGYLRFLPTPSLWKSLKMTISSNQTINRDEIINKINIMGYAKTDLITKTGEYANRGYILDIFPYGLESPVRIEFFDDEVEQIRTFDFTSQLSKNQIDTVTILPFSEFINEKNVADVPQRQSLLPRVVNKLSKLEEYLSDIITIFTDLDTIKIAYNKTVEEVLEFKQDDVFEIPKYMHDLYDVIPKTYLDILSVDNYKKTKDFEIETYYSSNILAFNGNYNAINSYLKKELKSKKSILVFLENKDMINDFDNKVAFKTIINPKFIDKDYINIYINKLPNGFVINDKVFLSSNEIYRKKELINYKSKFRYGLKIKDVNALKVGDYVVHFAYGIAKYLGIVTLTIKGLKKDFLNLLYKDDDKLYVPVEKIEYVTKYSSNEGVIPRLSKLGGTDWAKQKARIKSKVKDIAKELLETSAKRKLLPGFAFLPDDENQALFESKFNHEETRDQLKVIKEIKEDMQSNHPMDRLLCGDVGYGKTEVAFRAIFKAILSGKQACFLCPTTILSKQHYDNALERFEGFGVNIAVLNRFITTKQKKTILDDLKNGKIDLIIGTHRLLSDDVVYKDLGLLVIDEEQRFGVTHKEKIKRYKETIDVLTLSATPIPRTLQMSLTNVRGLSLIETPPKFRYPIQTYVLRENKEIIKDAIYKELSRQGQVFVLYNNVSKIIDKVSEIKKLVPEADITYIHGQMNKEQIEATMERFINHEYDILVCTTIIETGIDIENANTLIVLNADCFGLSQLYQIRGRIGRGKQIAYAYLMYEKNKELNDVAVKRLNAIKEFTELGSGYALALRDLSIRGAGDILGQQQSGFIDTIGYDMYIKILNEEVETLKGNQNLVAEDEKIINEKPFIQVSTHISDKYANSEELKIEIHKKINTINDIKTFDQVKKELTDRFGPLDNDVIIYMQEELFEVLSKQKGVFKVLQEKDKITIFFDKDKSSKINGTNLLNKLFKINPSFEIRYLNKMLMIILPIKNLEKHFLCYLLEMLTVIE